MFRSSIFKNKSLKTKLKTIKSPKITIEACPKRQKANFGYKNHFYLLCSQSISIHVRRFQKLHLGLVENLHFRNKRIITFFYRILGVKLQQLEVSSSLALLLALQSLNQGFLASSEFYPFFSRLIITDSKFESRTKAVYFPKKRFYRKNYVPWYDLYNCKLYRD